MACTLLAAPGFLSHKVGVPNWDERKILARAAATNSSSLDWSWSTAAENYKAKLCLDRGNGIINLTAIALTAWFHALSGFFALYDKLNLGPKANLTKIWEKGQPLCSRSWTNSGNDCFRVPYMASVIEDALCLGDRNIFWP